ncbi:cytochrome c biogenesis protein CcsA [Mucilaginibacter sp. dw_454]|uniref:cytochrome c biogenesis protein CcsA n=1 Tax=Mucilaginibacter sp. dw_454 TaxID=2720079 RepID=UPI001BD38A4B|nr:cytochrome c biogenesis protein CcsA [Mucilaginibacter sp. dw_454]
MDTAFKGEHLLPGHLGQFFTILAFGSALFAAISYYFAATNPTDTSWKRLGRIGTITNMFSVIGIGTCLYYVILNHLFEYNYASEHSSRALPIHFIISSFWDGQEGSFWLWNFWQGVISCVLVRKAKSWEAPVLTVIALSQAVLATMLIGVDIFGARIGSSPFILLREAIDLKSAPIFIGNPEAYHHYLAYIKDGNGMNPLLENYWMVIHPPTLFLGFASMVVPFAYAIAGLWQKRYKEWVSAALPYALFAMMILGTGIIMGAFWAYESLSFGGFWAWDPVENASIIPWLILVGAVHVMIVYKNTGHSYITTTILVLASFVLVLYASFLTRSGILGDTSVHAFTDAGLFWHLVADVVIFLVIAVVLLVIRWKELPKTTKDEETYSREFWMFVGAIFLCLSCFHLVVVSSIPVWNAIFGTKLAPPTDPVKHYNIVQASFAVVVTLLTGFTQFLKYKKTDSVKFFISTLVYLVIAVLITIPVIYFTGAIKLQFVFIMIMVGAIYSILANGKVLIDALKGKFKLAGSAVAHIGFGLIMVGALISAGTSEIISVNNTGEQFTEEFVRAKNNPRENLLMYKNTPIKMGKYTVTYVGDSVSAPDHFFKVDYKVVDASGKVTEHFILKPNAQANPKMGLIASPDTKHYLFSDLYTHITWSNNISVDDASAADGHTEADDDKKYEAPIPYEVKVGDTLHFREGYAILTSLGKVDKVQDIALTDKDVAIGAKLKVVSHDKTYEVEPVYMIRSNNAFDFARKVDDAGVKFRFSQVLPKKGKVEITVFQQPESAKKWIVMRAIQFPDINFLWSGTIIMVIGILLSIFRRNKELKVN